MTFMSLFPRTFATTQFGDPITNVELPVNFTVRGNNDAIKYNSVAYQDGADFPLGAVGKSCWYLRG